MQLGEQQYFGLFDRVVHEGEPELHIAPLSAAPDDLPAAWGKALTEHDVRPAMAQMWRPMADRVPRIFRALQERLRGVGLLRTEEIPASLLYFFADGNSLLVYRGRLPLGDKRLADARLPAEFLDFYRIHDGWFLYFSEDNGPAPRGEWRSLSELWPEVAWKVPPGELSLETSTVVYRDGDRLAFAYDKPDSTARSLVARGDGTVQLLLDIWTAIDRDVGEFLEGLAQAPGALSRERVSLSEEETKAMRRYDQLLSRVADQRSAAAHLGGAAVHEQACDLLLMRSAIYRRRYQEPGKTTEWDCRALHEWCAGIESGGPIEPGEVLDMFGLAHALGDAATAHFIATIPGVIWLDGSTEAARAQLLCELFVGDMALAAEHLEQVLGMTFDEEKPPDPHTEIVVRMLESLCQKNRAAYAEWRRKTVDKLFTRPGELNARLPWQIRLAGFDAVAFRLGIVEQGLKIK
jgi:hypothetical protein